MTTPKVTTIKRSGSRFYVHPTTRSKVPGVTSVVDMLPKQFLKFWAAKLVAETAVDNVGTVVQMMLDGGRDGAIDWLKRAPMRNTGAAADIGSEAHEVFEKMARGHNVGRVHPDMAPFRDHYAEFLDKFQPEFLYLEETVWSDTHGYAGSFDAIAKIEGEVVVLDNKTTRSGVHAEVALQLSAYRYADYILGETGDQLPMPNIEGGAVVHVRPEGWQLVPVRCDEDIHRYFTSLIPVFEWDKEVSKTVLGKPIEIEEV
jgi:hypothetical protein